MLFMPWVRSGKGPRDNRRPVATQADALYRYYENAQFVTTRSIALTWWGIDIDARSKLGEPPINLVQSGFRKEDYIEVG